jgi:hypothetical protein
VVAGHRRSGGGGEEGRGEWEGVNMWWGGRSAARLTLEDRGREERGGERSGDGAERAEGE